MDETERGWTVVAGLLPDQLLLQPHRASLSAKLSVGDRIAGADGCWQQVQRAAVQKFTGEVLRIKALGLLPIRLMLSQAVLTFLPDSEALLWKEARELDESTWLAVPRLRQANHNTLWDSHEYALPDSSNKSAGIRVDLADPEAAWFAGRYLADGSSTLYEEDGQQRGLASMYVGEKKQSDVNRVIEIARTRFNRPSPFVLRRGGEVRIDFGRTTLARLLRDRCGLDSGSKHLPAETWALPEKSLSAMLSGWMAGDACVTEGAMAGRTISVSLALGLQLAFARLGLLCSLRRQDRGEVSLRGTRVASQPVFNLSVASSVMRDVFGWTSPYAGSALKYRHDDQFIFVPIRTICQEPYSGPIHDIRTERRTCIISGAVIGLGEGKSPPPAIPRRRSSKRSAVAMEVA